MQLVQKNLVQDFPVIWDKRVVFHEAKNNILKFFSDKKFYAGGNIPIGRLLTEQNVRLVVNTSFVDGLNIAFDALKYTGVLAQFSRVKNRDTSLCLKFLSECASLGIPKEFRGGIFVLYIQFCQGVEIID